ncbi:tripartite tricarboxylate transporter substrate binding protein [Ottowia sp. GY511]|uniref:Bug family tripartite tricarboxylate transporter substrate binding protein n=1 Tax=Ottowia flava TaxID=2675430 RepID=A0ABW4KMA6_9BURK|nr:tripartite tricarboxylate transporter substrate binding protein [Ottowia sp. GY511]TXK26336.1 tripartite tricarboxylate transporter substrate binding protein [Ottowia sp. GY511]
MTYFSRRTALVAGAAAGMALLGPSAWAQGADNFPNKPIRIMYPFSPGGGMEVVLRSMAEHMQRTLGQPVIVDNRTGAGGSIAANAAATAAPDGYTLFVGPVGIMAITPQLRKLPYDAQKDLIPVAKLSEFNSVYIVANSLPVKTLPEFIAYAKAHPGKVTFASSGVGSQVHLAGEILQKNWGIKMTHVPYKGAADITTDLLAGRVDMSIDVTMLQYVKSGRARLLAVQYPKRLPDFPNVPTVVESGVPSPGTGGTWFGAFAPKGTPAPVVDKLSAAFEAALQQPDVATRMHPYAMEPAYAGPAAFKKQWDHDYAQYGKVIREQNIKLEN